MQAAKDFSTKSDKEKKAILGSALVINTTNNNDNDNYDDDRKKHKKSKKDKKDKKDKEKKSKKDDNNDDDNNNDNNDDDDITNGDMPRPRTRSMSSVSNTDEKKETGKRKATHDGDNETKKKKTIK